jgi:hypothetical protein
VSQLVGLTGRSGLLVPRVAASAHRRRRTDSPAHDFAKKLSTIGAPQFGVPRRRVDAKGETIIDQFPLAS